MRLATTTTVILLAATLLHGDRTPQPSLQHLAGLSIPKENIVAEPELQANQPAMPEMVAATDKPIAFGPDETRIQLRLHAAAGPVRNRPPGSTTVFLRVENVTCHTVAPTFSAYLNVPPGVIPEDRPELFAGSMGMFGLPESSVATSEHGGNGKSFALDITRLFHALEQRPGWNPQQLTVSFVPSYWNTPVPTVKVGRVSLYLQ